MNNLDEQYKALLKTIIDFGVEKSDRTGIGTKSVFGYTIRHNMKDGFPLLTTKKMYWKGIVTELLWFLRGDTNIKYLVDNDCHIWDGDAYKNYKLKNNFLINQGIDVLSQDKFINKIKTDDEFSKEWGDLGPIYGKQWRSWGNDEEFHNGTEYAWYGPHDQIKTLIRDLKENPDSRRLMVSAWNVSELKDMVLPPCHYGFQCFTRKLSYMERYDLWFINNYETGMEYDLQNIPDFDNQYYTPTPTRALSLMWNQRSVDTLLGLPFNIASYGLLLSILSKMVNMVPDQLIGNLGDTHLYLNHIDQANEQIGRKYTPEERSDMLKEAMGEDRYNKAVSELMPFGGGMSEYYDYYEIPRFTREPFELPKLVHIKTDEFYQSLSDSLSLFSHLEPSDFELKDYKYHKTIKAPLNN